MKIKKYLKGGGWRCEAAFFDDTQCDEKATHEVTGNLLKGDAAYKANMCLIHARWLVKNELKQNAECIELIDNTGANATVCFACGSSLIRTPRCTQAISDASGSYRCPENAIWQVSGVLKLDILGHVPLPFCESLCDGHAELMRETLDDYVSHSISQDSLI